MIFGVFVGSFLFVLSLTRAVAPSLIGGAGLTLALCATAQIIANRLDDRLNRRGADLSPVRPFRSNGLPGSSDTEEPLPQ